jgi:hypothetical protein
MGSTSIRFDASLGGASTSAGNELGYISFFGTDSSSAPKRAAYIISKQDAAGDANGIPGNIAFHTTSTGTVDATEKMIIKSTGNVGIGTTGPISLLHIGTNANTSLTIGPNSWRGTAADNTTYGLERSRNTIQFTSYHDNGSGRVGAQIAAINKQTWNSTTDRSALQSTDLAFSTIPPATIGQNNTIERMRITDSGNVGIGTSNPGDRLDVAGDIRIGNSDSINLIRFRGTAGDMAGAYTHTVIGEYKYAANEKSELLLFKANDLGNDLANNLSGPDRVRVLASGGFQVDTCSSEFAWPVNGAPPIGTPAFIVNSSRNVGIGRTVPQERLDLAGNMLIQNGNTARIFLGPSASTGNYDYCSMIEANSDSAQRYGSDLRFYTHSDVANYSLPTERMRITSAGNVGIGNGEPTAGYKLDVVGATRINGAFNATGAATLTGGLTVSGGTTSVGNLSISGTVTGLTVPMSSVTMSVQII